jgi:hypothetical protein
MRYGPPSLLLFSPPLAALLPPEVPPTPGVVAVVVP